MQRLDSRMKGIVEISKMVTGTDNFLDIKDAVVERMLKVIERIIQKLIQFNEHQKCYA